MLSDVVDLLERHRGGADATLRQQDINVGESMGLEGDKAGDVKESVVISTGVRMGCSSLSK